MTIEVTLRRPRFDLRFVTENSEFQLKYDAEKPTNNFMTESIISFTAKNAMEDDVAAFSFVLSGDMEWDKLLNENDLVILSVEPNPVNPNKPFEHHRPVGRTVIIGLVSEVRIDGTYDDNTKMYRITGQSFQKAFTNFELRKISQAGHASIGNIGWLDESGDSDTSFGTSVLGKTAADAANEVLDRFKGYMEYNFVKGEEEERNTFKNFFQDQVVYSIASWEDVEFLQDPLMLSSFEGSLNQFIKEIAAPPFLEFFFEVFPSSEGYEKAWLIIRRTPFDKEDWKNLSTIKLSTKSVISESIARNDIEAYSIYNIVPEMESETLALMHAIPWYSKKLVGKYGYKLLEVSSKFITTGSDDDAGEAGEDHVEDEFLINSAAGQFGKKLYEWYANNPNFYSGDITVVGHPDYKIGTRLVYENVAKSEIWEFYIESVEHSFSYADGYTTTLGVTRGLRVSGDDDHGIRFTPPAGKPERFKGGYLGEMSIDELAEAQKATEAEMNNVSGGYDAEHDITVSDGGFTRPSNGPVTSPYGMRFHPIHKEWRMHYGVDIGGGGNVYAMTSGKVLTAGTEATLGNYIDIHHYNINGKEVRTRYAHLSKMDVRAGQTVMSGQRIGIQGETGAVTGVHLHFEVYEDGSIVDPKKYVDV